MERSPRPTTRTRSKTLSGWRLRWRVKPERVAASDGAYLGPGHAVLLLLAISGRVAADPCGPSAPFLLARFWRLSGSLRDDLHHAGWQNKCLAKSNKSCSGAKRLTSRIP